MDSKFTKQPRLYTNQDLQNKAIINLDSGSVHYFKNVLRRQDGDLFRVFNGRDGEWQAEITKLGKKDGQAQITQNIKTQPSATPATHLFFSPIKKQRMDFLIEKAVELGVTDLHPIITARSEVRKIKAERIEAQIIEAAEQCERLTIPTLHPLTALNNILHNARLGEERLGDEVQAIPIYACLEREDAPPLSETLKPGPAAFLIGPEGGFDEDEINFLKAHNFVTPISLGEQILRSETAALTCLAVRIS